MPDDYFEDGQQGMPEQHGEPEAKEEGDDGGQTFLINAEVCPDMKPGDTLTLKIVNAHEGEYEVQYMPEDKEAEEAPAEAPMPAGDEMMD